MDNPTDGPISVAVENTGSVASGETSFNGPEWMSGLPDDLRESKSLSKFKDVENLARGYVNAQKLIGREQIHMPKTDEEFMDVYARLGCPSDVSGYNIPLDTLFPDNDTLQSAMGDDLKVFLPMAKEAGLNNKQAALIFGKYVEHIKGLATQRDTQINAEMTRAEAALKAEYGEQTDTKLAFANRALSALGDKELITAITDSGLGRNPAFIKMMVKVGEMHAEELGIDKTGSSGLMSPNDLSRAISELQAHPAYLDASHPEHRVIVDRVAQLFARANAK